MVYLCTWGRRAVLKGDKPVGAWLILHGALQRNKRNRLRSRAIFDLWFGLASHGVPKGGTPVGAWLILRGPPPTPPLQSHSYWAPLYEGFAGCFKGKHA